jgi:hypothetical protein
LEYQQIRGRRRQTHLLRYLVVAAVLLLFFARAIASYIIDFEWWREMGQVETWISMLLYGVTPGILASVIAFAAFWIAHARGMRRPAPASASTPYTRSFPPWSSSVWPFW